MDRVDLRSGRHLLGRNLRGLRLARGWTQDDLAAEAGVRQALISELECGKVDVRLDTLQRIALALGARLSELFEDGKR
ncbi:MAG TPA: helix-turn-helix transcriptional regulator [Pseudolabrys sp.]|nr:helix-turn-helix transcriptional regulator [Pseudolabrys sp.]